MGVFVEITPDPFITSFQNAVAVAADQRKNALDPYIGNTGEFDHVRRPVRGIVLKRDTYATIEVRTAKGERLQLADAGGLIQDGAGQYIGRTERYSNFLMQQVQESREEKQQIVLTFGEPYIFFYGEQPRIIQVSGVLMNTEDFNWRAEWWHNYENYLRGTKCVERRARVYLSWDDIIVEGFLLNTTAQENSQDRNAIQFQFQMFLTNYASIANLFDTDFPGVQGQPIQLNPASMDTTGEGIGTLRSSTLDVRQANLESDFLSKASLLDFVKQGLEYMVTAQDMVNDVMQMASQFLGGRVVRVPIGYQGSSVFDDTQLAMASVVGIGPNSTSAITAALGDRTFFVEASVADKWSKATYGKIQDNKDEYIVKDAVLPSGKPLLPPDIFLSQKADDSRLSQKVKETFLSFGINTEPPSDLLILAGRATFAMMNMVAPAGGFGSSADQASLVFGIT